MKTTIILLIALLAISTASAYDLRDATLNATAATNAALDSDFNTGLDISGNGEYLLITERGPGDTQQTYQIFLENPYQITTGWNITLAPIPEQIYPEEIVMSDDGEYVYTISWIGGAATYSSINVFKLTQPYNTSSRIAGSGINVQGVVRGSGLSINKNGTRLYVTSYSSDTIRQYDVTTPHDLSTATNTENLTIEHTTGLTFTNQDVEVSNKGTYLYVSGGGVVAQYRLSVPYEINSATFDYNMTIGTPRGIAMSPGGTRFYTLEGANITQYNLPGTTECEPNWTCYEYEACVYPATSASCINAEDQNNCGLAYSGDYEEFSTISCYYSGGGSGGSTDSTSPTPGPSDFENTDSEGTSGGTTTDDSTTLTTTSSGGTTITQEEEPTRTVSFDFTERERQEYISLLAETYNELRILLQRIFEGTATREEITEQTNIWIPLLTTITIITGLIIAGTKGQKRKKR